jgi:hypothetical protein
MPDLELGVDEDGDLITLSCHMLARAVAKIFPVKVRDGYFAGRFSHSWVETEHGSVIDVYPVAVIGGPFMFEGSSCSPQRIIYMRASARKLSLGRFGKNSFRRSVRRIIKTLRHAQSECGLACTTDI